MDRIAQTPAARREGSRLMIVDRAKEDVGHAVFADLASWLPPGALLVANDSLVIPARLRGRKSGSAGAVELLLLGAPSGTVAQAMVKVAKPLHEGQQVEIDGGVTARVASRPEQGRVLVDFAPLQVAEVLERCGEIPLPPYVERTSGPTAADLERYQTVYARSPGSVAAPTAGLHFTNGLLDELRAAGFGFATVTLHVGPGTFTPVRGDVAEHRMEEESYEIGEGAAAAIAEAKSAGRPVVAVGTTTVRALESAAIVGGGAVAAGPGSSRLFIRPGHRFAVVDCLLTNFHLPGSTLLALVMALAGRDRIREAYRAAVEGDYRFYSYGDAMLIR
ncbi:MAG: tRNA preQ1(34) S-adenosylmethionine ribosyltransferase-isomerase QueA [Candidatus Binatia bacterium]